MKIIYDPAFLEKLKKANVRVRKSVKEKIILFSQNPNNPVLKNHQLQRAYEGYRSINVTADIRILYKEIEEEDKIFAYFTLLGTHQELYR